MRCGRRISTSDIWTSAPQQRCHPTSDRDVRLQEGRHSRLSCFLALTWLPSSSPAAPWQRRAYLFARVKGATFTSTSFFSRGSFTAPDASHAPVTATLAAALPLF